MKETTIRRSWSCKRGSYCRHNYSATGGEPPPCLHILLYVRRHQSCAVTLSQRIVFMGLQDYKLCALRNLPVKSSQHRSGSSCDFSKSWNSRFCQCLPPCGHHQYFVCALEPQWRLAKVDHLRFKSGCGVGVRHGQRVPLGEIEVEPNFACMRDDLKIINHQRFPLPCLSG